MFQELQFDIKKPVHLFAGFYLVDTFLVLLKQIKLANSRDRSLSIEYSASRRSKRQFTKYINGYVKILHEFTIV